jgi:5-methyltetrahydropteroyltriglutamate--homocysteine methyltransferase
MDDAAGWGIAALHRAIEGVSATTAVHICYGYGIPANIEWKATLGGEWRQYEKFFPALAASRIDQVSLECINSHVPMSVLKLLDGKDVLIGVIDVATDTVETPGEVAAVSPGDRLRAKERIVACTNCGMAPCGATWRRRNSRRSRGARRSAAEIGEPFSGTRRRSRGRPVHLFPKYLPPDREH